MILLIISFSGTGSANYLPGEYPYNNEKPIPCSQLVRAIWKNGNLIPAVELPVVEIIGTRDGSVIKPLK